MAKSLHRSLEAKLAALEGPEWDSSDEEENTPTTTLTHTQKASKFAKKKSQTERSASLNKRKSPSSNEPQSSVIYLGHLPMDFEEGELKGFLSQFGPVKRIKLSRSKKTGNPRGYAFVEFADAEVAAIVAETMSGYFLMEKRLVCHVVPSEKIHEKMFDGTNRKFRKVDWRSKSRKEVNKPKTVEGMKKITDRLLKRESKKRAKLAALGIEYDFPGYEASKEAVAVAVATDASKGLSGGNKKEQTSSDKEGKDEVEVAENSGIQKVARGEVTPNKKKKRRKMSHDGSEEHPAKPKESIRQNVEKELSGKSAENKKKPGKKSLGGSRENTSGTVNDASKQNQQSLSGMPSTEEGKGPDFRHDSQSVKKRRRKGSDAVSEDDNARALESKNATSVERTPEKSGLGKADPSLPKKKHGAALTDAKKSKKKKSKKKRRESVP